MEWVYLHMLGGCGVGWGLPTPAGGWVGWGPFESGNMCCRAAAVICIAGLAGLQQVGQDLWLGLCLWAAGWGQLAGATLR